MLATIFSGVIFFQSRKRERDERGREKSIK